jgi:hypothetical protein
MTTHSARSLATPCLQDWFYIREAFLLHDWSQARLGLRKVAPNRPLHRTTPKVLAEYCITMIGSAKLSIKEVVVLTIPSPTTWCLPDML